jgi:zeaxanthin epoxidase
MPNLGQGGCQALEDAYVLNQELQSLTHKSHIPAALDRYQQRRWIRASAVQGLSRFASDIIIRGFDTPAKIYYDDVAERWQFENCNYAGIVTRLLQPFLPVFFTVQFNYLYDGYRNDKTIDVPATIGFTLLGGLIASLLSVELIEAGLAARWGLGALIGTEGAVLESTATAGQTTEGAAAAAGQSILPFLDQEVVTSTVQQLTQFLDKLF